MNLCIFKGNITKDIDIKTTNEHIIANISIAVNDGFGDKKTTSYINVVAFGKQAETINKFFKKGNPILVETRLKQSNYEKDGKKIYRNDFILKSFEFVGGNGNNSTMQNSELPIAGTPAYDEDIPF